MNIRNMQIVPPHKRKHRDELFDLVAKVFSGSGYFNMRDACRGCYIGNSHYDWDASRIGLIDGRIVTHVGVWDYQMRIGTARVRTGGVGAVATHGDYRKRGLMAGLMDAAIEAMRHSGYEMSLLFGIQDFYEKFGYVCAWASMTYVVDAADMPTERPGGRLQKFSLGARGDLDALYNRQYSRLTGTAVRPTFRRNRGAGPRLGYLWRAPAGKVAGYVVVEREDDKLTCLEACGQAEQSLRAAAALARRFACRQVRFSSLPYPHPLAGLIRRGTCRLECSYVRSGRAMVRTIDLAATLEKMASELTRRLGVSHLSRWRGRLLVAGAGERAMLSIGPDGVRVAEGGTSRHAIRCGCEIAQLLIGTDSPGEIARAGGIRLTGDAKKLLPVLFPNQYPVLGHMDSF